MKIITTHENPTFDAIAGVFAASLIHRDATIVLPRNIDRGQKNFLAAHFPDINQRAADGIDMSKITGAVLVCVKDIRRVPAVSRIFKNPNIYVTAYDKAPAIAPEIEVDSLVEAEYGSITSVILEKIIERAIEVPRNYATLFTLGIHEVTGSLLYPNTRAADVRCIAELLERGAQLNVVSAFLKDELSLIQKDALSKLALSRQVVNINGLDVNFYVAQCPRYIYKFESIVQRIAGEDRFNIAAFVLGMGGSAHAVIRNNVEEVNLGEIFLKIGGGGTRYAVSMAFPGSTAEAAFEQIRTLFKKNISPRYTARDIMGKPILFLKPETTVREADKILFRYGFSGAPLTDGSKISGFASRTDIEKALHHGLDNAPVSTVAGGGIIYVQPNESLENIRHKISQNEGGNIIVGSEKKPLGIITLDDVLNYSFDPAALLKKKKGGVLIPGEPARTGKKTGTNVIVPLSDHFSRHIMKFLRKVSRLADELKVFAYLVGGIARDIIIGKESLDIDIVIVGMSGIEFVEKLSGDPAHIVNRHERFKTATVKMPDLPKIDFATARSEFYKSPAALPDVFQSNLYQDLLRRDFTVNALAISLSRANFGLLVDYYGGFGDITKKHIKILHELSFIEDPTRIFRALRFKSRLGFKLEKRTETRILEAVKYGVIDRVEPIRISNELELIFNENAVYETVCDIYKYGLLDFIDKNMTFTDRIKSAVKNAVTILKKAAAAGKEFTRVDRMAVFFSILLFGVSLDKVQPLLFRMNMERQTRDNIINIVNTTFTAETEFKIKAAEQNTPDVIIYRIFKGLSIEGLLVFAALDGSKKAFEAVINYVTRLSKVQTGLNGSVLKQLGVRPGPLYKTILDAAIEEKIAGGLKTHVDEIKFVMDFLRIKAGRE